MAMDVAGDFYATLGVERQADDAAIRRAYRKLMRTNHPDVNPSAEASARAAAINEAYACLHDPQKRAAYDRAHRVGRAYRPAAPLRPLNEYRPGWDHRHLDRAIEETPLLRRWKLVALGLAAAATLATFAMTSSVSELGSRVSAAR